MKLFLHVPLFVIVLIIYNIALLANRDSFKPEAAPVKPSQEQTVPAATPAPAAATAQPAPAEPASTAAQPVPAGETPATEAVPAAAQAPQPPAPIAATAGHPLDRTLFHITLLSGAKMPVTIHEFLLILAVFFLYIELFKSTRTANATIVEHVLSLLVFMAFFVELLVFRPAGTPAFLIMTLLSFLDVIAGFTITISTARRDFGAGAHATAAS